MPNRNASESEPEYQELMSGRSPHKGLIELFPVVPEPPQLAETTNKGEAKPEIPTLHPGLRERMSDLFHHLWH